MQTLKEFVKTDSAATYCAKIPSGIWQTWEELDFDGLESTLGFRCDVNIRAEKDDLSHANELSSVIGTVKDRVLSSGLESTRDMVESWNLAWTELWYFIRVMHRRRKSEQLNSLSLGV